MDKNFYTLQRRICRTTVGQLNFCMGHRYKYYDYVISHYTDIENHMSDVNKKRKTDAIDVKIKNEKQRTPNPYISKCY